MGWELADPGLDHSVLSQGAELIVEAAHLGIDLLGPVPIAGGRQEREGRGYGLGDFTIDFDAHTATCPQGKTSTRWIDTKIDGHPRIHVDFYNAGCPACPAKPDCPKARYRGLTLHPREQHEALQRRRREQDADAWRERYATRAGVEGAPSPKPSRPATPAAPDTKAYPASPLKLHAGTPAPAKPAKRMLARLGPASAARDRPVARVITLGEKHQVGRTDFSARTTSATGDAPPNIFSVNGSTCS